MSSIGAILILWHVSQTVLREPQPMKRIVRPGVRNPGPAFPHRAEFIIGRRFAPTR
jgi:hypothetical protein